MLRSVGINNISIPLFDVGTSPYFVSNIDGLEPPKSTIHTMRSLNKEGSWFNSSQIENRYISIDVKLSHTSNYGWNIDSIREYMYSNITIGSITNLRFTTDKRTYHIKGALESIDAGIFTKEPSITMNFVCFDPFFSDGRLIIENSTSDNYGAKELGTAPSGFILKKTFDRDPIALSIMAGSDRVNLKAGSFRSGDTMVFSSMDNDMFVNIIRSGTSNPVNYMESIVSGTMFLRLSLANPRVMVLGTGGSTGGFELKYERRFYGI